MFRKNTFENMPPAQTIDKNAARQQVMQCHQVSGDSSSDSLCDRVNKKRLTDTLTFSHFAQLRKKYFNLIKFPSHHCTLTLRPILIPLIFFLCCGLLILPACSRQEIINNKETGEISAGKPSDLQDGTYLLTAQYYDHRGYRQKLEATVCSGIITKVVLTETTANGTQKTDDETWPKKETNLGLSEIYHLFASQIVEKQDAKIDTISGATKTTSDFETLAESFITQAKNGSSGQTTVCLGDTYVAESSTQSGFDSTLSITFDNADNITDVSFSESLNEISRTANPTYRQLYAEMCAETQAVNRLTPLNEDIAYMAEYERYNALLTEIDNLRNGTTP